MECPFCKKELKNLLSWYGHRQGCKGQIEIPDNFHYVECPLKRLDNAKEIIKKEEFYVNGIGDFSKIKTDIINECMNCKYQAVIGDEFYYDWFPYWLCNYKNLDKDKFWRSPIKLEIKDENGLSLLSYIDNIDKNIRRLNWWEHYIKKPINLEIR